MKKDSKKEKKQRTPFQKWTRRAFLGLAALAAATIAVSKTFLYDLICLVLGQKRAVYAEDSTEQNFAVTTADKADALAQANTLVEEVAGEGIVMVRNESALPLAGNARISVFGKNSVNLVYSGSGSGSGDNSLARTIYESLEEAGFTCNPELKAFYESTSRSGDARGNNSNFSQDIAKFDTGETPYEKYESDGVTDSYADYNDAALIVLSRIGGEEFDLTNSTLAARDRHYLEVDENEEALIRKVCAAGFGHVILIVNSANIMDLGFVESGEYGSIDACLLMGAPGNNGVMALGRILNGTVNPSGHTVDTWIHDFSKHPTAMNFGDNGVEDGDRYTADGKSKNYFFVDYEEGIYVGYRYYETADHEASQGNYEGFDYASQVVYPFGYGLSYTTFSWTLKDDSAIKNKTIGKNDTCSVTVTVTNTGDVPGKDVVQLYVNAPYTPGGIEKPYKVLTGFAKTGLLAAGESCDLTIEFTPYDFASYDYTDAAGTGAVGYKLDEGEYHLFVSHDAHHDEFDVPFSVSDGGILFNEDTTTGAVVENRFEGSDAQLQTLLSRQDFAGTWPSSRSDEEKSVSSEFINELKNSDINNPETWSEIPEQGVSYDETITYRMMTNVPYEDEKWDQFMNQLTVDEMLTLFNQGAFKTESVERLGVPKTTCSDGPVGFVAFQGSATVYGACNYCCEVMMASTWNTELMSAIGSSLAQEGLWGNQAGDGMPYSGIYAPGSNIHRSPFGGRNWEYFSEDGFLAGKLAAAEIKAASEGGLVMFMKHFALNDQETHRNAHGLCTWANEQSIRELYLKPFEKAVKEGGASGIMSSFNRIGSVWAGGSYSLLTGVLRQEWGFKGTVICDYITDSYCDQLQALYAGQDLDLTSTIFLDSIDTSNAGDVRCLRQAAKNILYTMVHSNAMNGEITGYKPPVWQEIVFGVDAAAVVLAGLLGLRAWKKTKKMTSVNVLSAKEETKKEE